jgi:hypothetical protein
VAISPFWSRELGELGAKNGWIASVATLLRNDRAGDFLINDTAIDAAVSEMISLLCSGCGQEIELPLGTRSGDTIACPN